METMLVKIPDTREERHSRDLITPMFPLPSIFRRSVVLAQAGIDADVLFLR